jgi:hypothetical protein
MKKRFVILPIIAVAAGGHYYVWQKQTNNFAANIEKQINDFNAQAGEASFSYAAKKLSGYPSKSVVTYIKPILKEGDNSINADGNLVIALDALGNQVDVRLDGNIKAVSNQTNYGLTSKDGLACKFQASKEMIDAILTQKEIGTSTYADLGKNFKHIGCQIADMVLVEGGKQISSAEDFNFAFNSNPTTGTEKMIDFSLQVKELEMAYSPAMSNYYGHYYGLDNNISQIINKAAAQAYEDAGKQNFVMSGSAIFDSANSAEFHFNLREFKISNNLYTLDFPLEIKKEAEILVKHNGSMVIDKKYDAATINFAKNLWQAAQSADKNDGEAAEIIAKIKEGSVSEDLVINIMPQLEKYSEIKTYVNLSGSSDFTNAKIEKMGFSTALFSLIVSGDSNLQDSNIEVVCENCDAMIDSFANYSNDWAKLMQAFGKTQSEEMISAEKINAIKSFYRAFDSDNDDKNITWKIVKKGSDITISGKKLEDFMQKTIELGIPIPPIM